MIQAPNLVNPYLQQPQVQPYVPQYAQQGTPAPNYNAVKIDVHNPSRRWTSCNERSSIRSTNNAFVQLPTSTII